VKTPAQPADAFDFSSRLKRLREALAAANLQALLVTGQENIRYLSGFRGSSGSLLITLEEGVLLSDFRYRLQAAEQAPDFRFREVEPNLLLGAAQEVKEKGLKTVGFEAHHLTLQQFDSLRSNSSQTQWEAAGELVEGLRLLKEPAEIAAIAHAAEIADHALAHLLSRLAPGRKEQDIAREGAFFIVEAGAKSTAFDVIIASGPRGALPHAESGARPLTEGDLVILDLGARLPSGYCSDLSRTVAIGKPQNWQRELYCVVWEAQAKGLAALRPGAIMEEVDAAARHHIAAAGHAEFFGHGLGHGVGLSVHEAPRLAKGQRQALAVGMVATIEPGVYFPEKGGVRIEDLVVITEEGYRLLSNALKPKELPVI